MENQDKNCISEKVVDTALLNEFKAMTSALQLAPLLSNGGVGFSFRLLSHAIFIAVMEAQHIIYRFTSCIALTNGLEREIWKDIIWKEGKYLAVLENLGRGRTPLLTTTALLIPSADFDPVIGVWDSYFASSLFLADRTFTFRRHSDTSSNPAFNVI